MPIIFSETWLREWIYIDFNTEELAEKMNMLGLEVEKIDVTSNYFSNIVVGKVIKSFKNQIAKNLYHLKIDIGEKVVNILCKKENCLPGMKVAVAKTGAVLPNNTILKKIKIQDKYFDGFVCFFSTLLLRFKDKDQIITFSKDVKIGKNVYDFLKIKDHIFTLNITPNRSDCLSILGIARDLSTINNIIFLKKDKIKNYKNTKNIKDKIKIKINEPKACPFYIGRIIKNININVKLPIWITEKLSRSGFKITNSILDVANYVLLEIGQPIFIFDFEKINSNIIIRFAKEKEKFFYLKNNTILLQKNTLVVSDEEKILSLAGIENSILVSPTLSTCNILIQSAFFNPEIISGKARYYGINSEYAYRYERGIDPMMQNQAIEYITFLILKLYGGKSSSLFEKKYKNMLPKKVNITFSSRKINRLLGYKIPKEKMFSILIDLGCKIITNKKKYIINPPSWRFDLNLIEDLAEEIARIYGYKNIPNKPFISYIDTYVSDKKKFLFLKKAKVILVSRGYNECITYSFINPILQKMLYPNIPSLLIPKPLSKDMSVMRISLLPGLISSLIYNQNYQQNQMRLFESGLCFLPKKNDNLKTSQKLMLSGILNGNQYSENWSLKNRNIDFYDLKGDIESIFEIFENLKDLEFRKNKNFPFILHPKKSAIIYFKNIEIGFIGFLNPIIKQKLNILYTTIVFEILWDKILFKKILKPKISKIAKFPINRRDISIILPEEIPVDAVIFSCKKSISKYLIEANIFDVYYENIKSGYKSISISLLIQNKNRTLQEKEISKVVEICLFSLKKEFNAELRL